jgi:hypothetical protein
MGIDRLELLAGQAEREEIQALPAVTHREAYSQDAEFAHAFEHPGDGLLLAVMFLDDRRHFLLGEVAHHFLGHEMFGG